MDIMIISKGVALNGKKDVYNFAMKWSKKFFDPSINYIELVDHYLADDCSALGFEMDCGYAFEEKFEKAAYDARALDKIIENVNDISLLGSAIYSRWRYFNHWVYDATEIFSMPNRSWLIIALNRLAELCKDEQEK